MRVAAAGRPVEWRAATAGVRHPESRAVGARFPLSDERRRLRGSAAAERRRAVADRAPGPDPQSGADRVSAGRSLPAVYPAPRGRGTETGAVYRSRHAVRDRRLYGGNATGRRGTLT